MKLHDRETLVDTEHLHSRNSNESDVSPPTVGDEESTCLFSRIRAEKVDYTFHKKYSREREHWQNTLLKKILNLQAAPPAAEGNDTSKKGWIIFTGGPMGVGKGHVMRYLREQGILTLPLVPIDPDRIRRAMPEWRDLVRKSPLHAGALTHKEAGLIAEIATEAAMRLGQHIWVDGSLRDTVWVKTSISDIRKRFPNYLIGIIYVTASRAKILERAERRGRDTGRVVPPERIDASIHGSFITVNEVAAEVDLLLALDNDRDNADPSIVAIETRGVRRAINKLHVLNGFFQDPQTWVAPWAELGNTGRLWDENLLQKTRF